MTTLPTEPVAVPAAVPATFGPRVMAYIIDGVLSAGLVSALASVHPMTARAESLAVVLVVVVLRGLTMASVRRTPGMVLGLLRATPSSRGRLVARTAIEAVPLYVIAATNALSTAPSLARAAFVLAVLLVVADDVVVPRLPASRGWTMHDRMSGASTFPNEEARATWKQHGVPWPVRALSLLTALAAVACVVH